MARKKVGTQQVRFNVPSTAFERLQRLADALSMSVPDLVRTFVSVQLVQWEAMYLHPEKFAEVASRVGGAPAAALVDQMASDAAGIASEAPRHDPPGFRPGGKPRSLVEVEAESIPGSQWTGYLHGL